MNMHAGKTPHPWMPYAIVASALALLFGIYSFGFGGIFFFDDPAALDGMKQVHDLSSALLYITTGTAGALGRPVALASFLLNADAYPDKASEFFLFNTLLHLSNVALVALAIRQLQHLRPDIFGRSIWLPPATALLWGILPILASTSLMAVQRMTSLSAFFTLLGVLAYLTGRHRAERVTGALLTGGIIWLCTALATLSKENGALLPLYILLLQYTLLRKSETHPDPASPRGLRTLEWIIAIPAILFATYLISRLPGAADAYHSRPFTLWERLATQPIILWEYIHNAFLPRIMSLSPFRDDYPAYQFSNPAVWLAISGWIAAVAIGIRQRKRYPVILFGIGWYLTGHLLESTFIPLQLYFEHRNYLPILGPVMMLCASVTNLNLSPKLKSVISTAYLAFLGIMLWQTTSIWGNRELLYWAQSHPDSPRAIQTIAGAYLNAGKVDAAIKLYDDAFNRNPNLSSVAMQGLRLKCHTQDRIAFQAQLEDMIETLPNSHRSNLALASLSAIQQLQLSGNCPHLEIEELQQIIEALQRNPMFQSTYASHHLHSIRAETYLAQGNPEAARNEYQKSLEDKPDLQAVSNLYKLIQYLDGDEAAQAFIREFRDNIPSQNPWVRKKWRQAILNLTSQ